MTDAINDILISLDKHPEYFMCDRFKFRMLRMRCAINQAHDIEICEGCDEGYDNLISHGPVKFCPVCEETKPLTAKFFHKQPRTSDGFAYRCKVCERARKTLKNKRARG